MLGIIFTAKELLVICENLAVFFSKGVKLQIGRTQKRDCKVEEQTVKYLLRNCKLYSWPCSSDSFGNCGNFNLADVKAEDSAAVTLDWRNYFFEYAALLVEIFDR